MGIVKKYGDVLPPRKKAGSIAELAATDGVQAPKADTKGDRQRRETLCQMCGKENYLRNLWQVKKLTQKGFLRKARNN